jgi:hypothetical protein
MVQHDSTGPAAVYSHAQDSTAVLVVRTPPLDRGRYAGVTGAGLVVGRGESSDLVLTDPSVSRRHAMIRRRDGKYAVEDLGSLNGTYLNGKRVTAPSTLRDGDNLRFGGTAAEFRLALATRPEWEGPDSAIDPDWNPGAPTKPINPESTYHTGHTLRDDLHAAPGFSASALLLALLGSVVGTTLLSALESDAFEGGPWWRLVGAAVGPVISTTFTTKQAGEKGRVRAAIIVLVSSAALFITVSGTSLTEFASRTPVLPSSDEGGSTFPVPGLSSRMSGNGSDGSGTGTGGREVAAVAIQVTPGELECAATPVDPSGICGSVAITSTGSEPVSLQAVRLEGSHPQDFSFVDQCGESHLDTDHQCEIHVSFLPTEPGDREALLVVEHTASDEPAVVTLRGLESGEVEPVEAG